MKKVKSEKGLVSLNFHFRFYLLQNENYRIKFLTELKLKKIDLANNYRVNIEGKIMCRNIKTLYNFEPPVTDDEIRAAAIQYVRKISGFSKPSMANEAAFETAIAEISASSQKLMDSLVTDAPTKNREIEAEKARERNRRRFGKT